MSDVPNPVTIVKRIAKQGRQYVMIIPLEYVESGSLELGYYYEVTFRRLKKVEKKAVKENS